MTSPVLDGDAACDVTVQEPPRRVGVTGVLVVLALLVAGLLWAKWLPYAERTRTLSATGAWSGSAIFGASGEPGSAPSVAGALDFTRAYAAAVWKAALVALVVAAAIESLVPRRWFVRLMSRRSAVGQGVTGAALSLPSMMCTCCTAPVAIGLRRKGAPIGATVAYWLGNPLLNPAVLVFLALTLPWQLVAVRVVVGVVIVLGAAVAAAAVAGRVRGADVPAPEISVGRTRSPWLGAPAGEEGDATQVRELPLRFARTLVRYVVVLVPEYLVLVLLTGWLSGWLSDFAGLDRAAGPVALLVVGLVGAALVIPTGGEIPVVAGLVAAGAGFGVVGVVLVTLPALSIPSILMVARTFSWRVTAAVTSVVVVGGIVAGLALQLVPVG
ncbi:permease [Terrabacter aeriphilus]|uniref:permease n=1 Tax=Terrabacter aeriphilus TaxID=515662 RepID=UPI0031EED824